MSPTDGSPLKPRVTYRKMKFFRREPVADKIDSAIASAEASRLALGMSMVGIFQNQVGMGPNTSSVNFSGTTVTSGNRSAAQGSVDITLEGKPMLNTTMFVDLEGAVGSGIDSLSAAGVALNAHSVNTQALPEGGGVPLTTFFLREAWFEVQTPGRMWALQAGQIDLAKNFDENFYANDETSQFLSGDFVNNPVLENPSNPAQAKAYNALGGVLSLDTFHGYVAKFGAENSTTNPVNPTDTLFLVGELQDSYNLLGQDGILRVWARQKPRGDGQPQQALGFSWNQRLGNRLGVFARYGKSSYAENGVTGQADNLYDYAASGGLELGNFIPARLKDRMGLAVGRVAYQDGSREENGEAYYKMLLTSNFNVSLHYQAVFSRLRTSGPDGQALEAAGAVQQPIHVLGLRTQMNY